MAILGGAGNPVGGSFTGPAQALEYIGDHCYAYSGVVNDASSGAANATLFDFQTGNNYVEVQISLLSDAKSTEDNFLEITLNGAIILAGNWDNDPTKQLAPLATLLLAPYSEFVMKWGCSANKNITAVLTGNTFRFE